MHLAPLGRGVNGGIVRGQRNCIYDRHDVCQSSRRVLGRDKGPRSCASNAQRLPGAAASSRLAANSSAKAPRILMRTHAGCAKRVEVVSSATAANRCRQFGARKGCGTNRSTRCTEQAQVSTNRPPARQCAHPHTLAGPHPWDELQAHACPSRLIPGCSPPVSFLSTAQRSSRLQARHCVGVAMRLSTVLLCGE